jgi:hypothetical protein
MDNQIAIEKLLAFKAKDKFSYSEWNDRGLNPSGDELCRKLEALFNECATLLIKEIESNPGSKKLKRILKNSFKKFNANDYDTEEKEFISDYFYKISQIIEIDFKKELNVWIYGYAFTLLINTVSFFKGKEKIVEILSQDCTKCGSKLETFILRKEEGIPDHSWNIIKCNNCNEYNLTSNGPNIKQLRFGNYSMTEQLEKSAYTRDEAEMRLKQIKFFRKG